MPKIEFELSQSQLEAFKSMNNDNYNYSNIDKFIKAVALSELKGYLRFKNLVNK